ncbi:Retrovirus-related Pol polyprotein from type-1 retrotransposable element [Trichinella papuae]|uniref:Retrovirus-related Pol polyprotein from type-1 retrotransposable element n=1 Tax=Trichinella papuae TaxID=268474 RepID=A0A0V1M7J1_9BILA|nr:Retrovirus-related Pol polyprotein from type-1 retrotransposable element [Trichinella papuae]
MAVKFRSNTAATRAENNRGRTGIIEFRVCKGAKETLAHICQKCPSSQGLVIQRHNAIVDFLEQVALRDGFQVTKEPKLPTPAGALKHDLLLIKANTAFIVDVGVAWEGRRPLKLVSKNKVENYKVAIPAMLEICRVDHAESHGVILGSRGCWLKTNDKTLSTIGLKVTRRMKERLSWLTFEHSIRIYNVYEKLSALICKKHFNTINSVACHYPHCKKQANREPTPATVTPLDPEVTASVENVHICTACSRTFNTHNGLRLHEKRKHASKFMASSQAPKHHRWSDDELHDVRVTLMKLENAGSSSIAVLAEELSRLWQESISVNSAKYLRKKVRSTESRTVKPHAQAPSRMTTDCVNSQMESLSQGANTTKSEGEARKHYTDGVAQVLSTLLRPNRDGRKPPAPTNPRKGRLPPPVRNRSERKRSHYASFQSLFRRDPKRIAAHLIKNQPLCNVSCPIDVAESALRQR